MSGRRFTLGGKRGFQTFMEDVPLCEKRQTGTQGILKVWDNGPPGTLRILTGLLPRVSARLRQAGYRVEITGRMYGSDQSTVLGRFPARLIPARWKYYVCWSTSLEGRSWPAPLDHC